MCNPFEILNITALLVRLVQTITKCLGIKHCDLCFQEIIYCYFNLRTLQYVVPLLLIAPIVGLISL